MIHTLFCIVFSIVIAANLTPGRLNGAEKKLLEDTKDWASKASDEKILAEARSKLGNLSNYSKSSKEYLTIAANLQYIAHQKAFNNFDEYSSTRSKQHIDNNFLEKNFKDFFEAYIKYYIQDDKFKKDPYISQRDFTFDRTLAARKKDLKNNRKFYVYLLVQNALPIRDKQAKAKLKQDEAGLAGKNRVKESSFGLAAHILLSSETQSGFVSKENADRQLLYRNGLTINVKEIGYDEAIKCFKNYAYAKDKSAKNVSAAQKAFFNAFLKHYVVHYNLTMATKELAKIEEQESAAKKDPENTEELVSTAKKEEIIEEHSKKIKRLENEIISTEKIFSKEKDAYAKALVIDALKNPSQP